MRNHAKHQQPEPTLTLITPTKDGKQIIEHTTPTQLDQEIERLWKSQKWQRILHEYAAKVIIPTQQTLGRELTADQISYMFWTDILKHLRALAQEQSRESTKEPNP